LAISDLQLVGLMLNMRTEIEAGCPADGQISVIEVTMTVC
jgi:hypothetical protein